MPIFKIEDTYFSYNRKKENAVLHVKSLDIPEGKVVFLLGASGSGKSTILEALGLMNHTIAEGSVQFTNRQGKNFNLSTLWENLHNVASLRRDSFSFIFQSTNLMDNFSAYENAALPSMIKLGKTKAESVETSLDLMDRVGLGPTVLNHDKYAINLSGGQRQRLSFVRALNTDFDVLLCDEPTGNLDARNANELLGIVRERVIGSGKSAVIVSHDIDLALQYADIIVGIGRDESGRGYIDNSLVFDLSQLEKAEVRKAVLSLYQHKSGKEKGQNNDDDAGPAGSNHIKFSQLFRKNEGKALLGKRYLNFFVLAALFFITTLAIGFSNGSFKYLADKMDNPFTQWIIVKVPYDKGDAKVKEISNLIQSGATMEKFRISNVSSFKEDFVKLKPQKKNEREKYFLARTFEQTNGKFDPILKDVLSSSNIIRSNGELFSSHLDLSVIVTEKLLRDLYINPDSALFLPYPTQYTDDLNAIVTDTFINIPIRAIVKRIPDKVHIGFTQAFYFFNRGQGNAFNPFVYTSLSYFIPGEVSESKLAKENLTTYLKKAGLEAQVSDPKVFSQTIIPGHLVKVSLSGNIEKSEYGTLNRNLFSELSKKITGVKPVLDFDDALDFKMVFDRGDYFSLNFSNFEEIEKFDEWLGQISVSSGDPKPLSVDTSRVREKKNFMFLSQVLKILAFLLILISTIGISIFSSNLLKMHLEKVKMNIGTFLAFGLSSLSLRLIYLQIVAFFLSISALAGFSLSLLIGSLSDVFLVATFVKENDVSFFHLITPASFLLLAIIVLTSCAFGWVTINKMLKKTPGDLIYNR